MQQISKEVTSSSGNTYTINFEIESGLINYTVKDINDEVLWMGCTNSFGNDHLLLVNLAKDIIHNMEGNLHRPTIVESLQKWDGFVE